MPNRAQPNLDDASLLYHLDELVRTYPGVNLVGNPTLENLEWIGRARALISAWDQFRSSAFQTSCDQVLEHHHSNPNAPYNALVRLMGTLQEARSALRLNTNGHISGAFSAGQPFDIFDELRKVIETAQRDLLCVDRYMGADFVSMYLPHVPQGVAIRLLTRDKVPQLTSALAAYCQQHQLIVEARTSQGIHGRFLAIDSARSFIVDASFKDAAKSAPAALIELTDTAVTSLAQYEALWQGGSKAY